MSLSFPTSFLFGTATAATQIEGHCFTSNWWAFAQEPGRVHGGDTPHPACDVWNRFEQDMELHRGLGANAYRLSIEWARVEPTPGQIDHEALDRYRSMLGSLRDASIEPMVTLHHFTLPRWVSQRGGLLSPSFPSYFESFVRVAVEALGDLSTRWITINEPNVVASLGYLLGTHPPGRTDARQAIRAQESLLAAHVLAYRAIHEIAGRHGRAAEAGVAHHLRVVQPARPSHPADRLGARLLNRVFNESFAGALCGEPQPAAERLVLGLAGTARVDARGTQDFFGLNYYGRDVVRFSRAHPGEMFVHRDVPDGVEVSDLGWEVYPEGLGQLVRTWARRSGVPVYVTENGIADARDAQRPSFLVRHLAQIAEALREGVDVRGYFHWSLLDNFEWAEGYEPRFGLYEVDYATQERIARPSAEVFRRIATTRGIGHELWREHGGVPEQAWRHGS